MAVFQDLSVQQRKRQRRQAGQLFVLLNIVTLILPQCHSGCLAFTPLTQPTISSTKPVGSSPKLDNLSERRIHTLYSVSSDTTTASKAMSEEQNDQNYSTIKNADFSSMSSMYQPKPPTTLHSYTHTTKNNDDWTLTYRYKPASPGHENDLPLLLIHPVGIGLSSWFWDKFLDEWVGGEVYAPDLIGCGLENGVAEKWIPEKKGLFFPLSWVQGCETLVEDIILPAQREKRSKIGGGTLSSLLGAFTNGDNARQNNSSNKKNDGIIIVSQGGLAPVGISLASRNSYPTSLPNKNYVKGLILTSPPKWNEMITPIPEKNLADQYDFFTSKIRGGLAFAFLETKWAVNFFSNFFLFSDECDDEWTDRATGDAACKEARTPVMSFNAGFCNARSYEEELKGLEVKTLVLSGLDDGEREEQRQGYGLEMMDCRLESIEGKNVLPWESPSGFCGAIERFIKSL